MNYCKSCGKKLELTPEYDMCMECQGKQHQAFTLPSNNNTISNKTEMTPKEALKWLFLKASKQHYQLWAIKLTKPYGERKKLVDEITSDLDNHGGELNDTFNIIEQALTELEFYKSFPQLQEASLIPEVNLKLVTCELQLRELKRDVKIFSKLVSKPTWLNAIESENYDYLKDKLLKVGNEK